MIGVTVHVTPLLTRCRDLEAAELPGWYPEGPAFLRSVQPAELSGFGLEVHQLWRVLHRKVGWVSVALAPILPCRVPSGSRPTPCIC